MEGYTLQIHLFDLICRNVMQNYDNYLKALENLGRKTNCDPGPQNQSYIARIYL